MKLFYLQPVDFSEAYIDGLVCGCWEMVTHKCETPKKKCGFPAELSFLVNQKLT